MLRTIILLFCFTEQIFAVTSSVYRSEKLKNGMELVFVEDHKVPLVTIVLSVKAGSMTETPDINGLTHLWEHMFFKGNKTLPNQEAFNRRIRQLGIVYNGDTAAEKVRYFFTLPAAYLDEGLQFMADAIMTPLLDQSELEKERKVVLDEYDRNASQPGFELYKVRRELIYQKLGFLRDPLGVRKIIETWAPAGENGVASTEAYVQAVAKALNVRPDSTLVWSQKTAGMLAKAIAQHENGEGDKWVSDDHVTKAWNLMG
jgi:zinc protease